MDYTSSDLVKAELKIINSNAQTDTLIARQVTAASRAFDRQCVHRPDVVDYFASVSVSNELLDNYHNPIVDRDGRMHLYPHKPVVTEVTGLNFRLTPRDVWQSVDPSYLRITNGVEVVCDFGFAICHYMVQVSYTGGLGTDLTSLPADLVEAVTVLAGRFYKQAEAGLADSVGMGDTGFVTYTKAMPVQVVKMLEAYKRVVPW